MAPGFNNPAGMTDEAKRLLEFLFSHSLDYPFSPRIGAKSRILRIQTAGVHRQSGAAGSSPSGEKYRQHLPGTWALGPPRATATAFSPSRTLLLGTSPSKATGRVSIMTSRLGRTLRIPVGTGVRLPPYSKVSAAPLRFAMAHHTLRMMRTVVLFAYRRSIAIFNRLGEAVALTEPLAKVDQPATLVAEGSPLGFGNPGDRLAAIGAGNCLGRGVHVQRGGGGY